MFNRDMIASAGDSAKKSRIKSLTSRHSENRWSCGMVVGEHKLKRIVSTLHGRVLARP